VTEADVQNEEMYEEEDDLSASFAYGLGSSSLELRMRMQAYWEQQFALRNAMSLAAAGGNLNATTQPPLSLRDYYQRFAQQYPLSLTSNQYLFPTAQIPTNVQQNLAPPIMLDPTSPSISSTHSGSPTKSPINAASAGRPLSVSSAPYSVSNSQRNRRLSSNTQAAEHPQIQHQQAVSVNAPVKAEPVECTKPKFTDDVYAAQPFQSSIAPFTTQLPTHMQQYHLPDFVDQSQNIPTYSIPLDKLATTDDLFSSDWTSFLGQTQVSSKVTPYVDDGTNWDDYLDGDANWLLGPQPEHES
jgi:hypothetical protein